VRPGTSALNYQRFISGGRDAICVRLWACADMEYLLYRLTAAAWLFTAGDNSDSGRVATATPTTLAAATLLLKQDVQDGT